MPAQVNVATGTGDGASGSIAASAVSHTAGNLIVVFVGWEDSGTLSTITDTAGNKYDLGVHSGTIEPLCRVGYARNCLGNASNVVTATFTGTPPFRRIIVVQYSGIWPEPAVVDATVTGANQTPSTTLTTGNLVTVNANDLLVVGTKAYTTGTFSDFTNWTEIAEVGNQFGASERIVTSANTYSAGQNFSVSSNWAGAAMAFKSSVSPSTLLYRRMSASIRQEF